MIKTAEEWHSFIILAASRIAVPTGAVERVGLQ